MSGPKREYRVVWKRDEWARKTKRFTQRKAAERLVFVMTSDEPWRAFFPEKGPDDFACCSGSECGCAGETVRQDADRRRAGMPPLEWVRIEWRTVGEWTPEPDLPLPGDGAEEDR